MKKIVIKSVDKPVEAKSPDAIISWFCEVFGLSGSGEPDSIESDILKRFLVAAARNEGISSSEIKLGKDVPRSTVIYHLNRLIESGLVVKRGRKYYMRAQGLSTSLEEVEYDIDREFQRMIDIAREFDRLFEMHYRGYSKKLEGGREIKIE
ncbi:MAG: winged helix-turn-helix domain-containing protein [Candidatus Micrarchaeaceae archaeon]